MAAHPITAYTLCNGLGSNVAEVSRALREGRSGLDVGSVDEGGRSYMCGIVRGLDPLPSELAAYDTRQARLALMTLAPIESAIERACRRWGPRRLGVVIGTSTGGIGATEAAYAAYHSEGALPKSFDLERHHAMQATVEVVARKVGAKGPAYAVSTACSSSGKALGAGARLIDAGLADAAIVGGVDSLCEMTLRGFDSLEVLSSRRCRPFSAEREGINLGEGGAFLLLERQGSSTVALLAVGESNDAHHMSAPHPEGVGARLAMERALARARVDPAKVAYVNAHGTGTKLNDAAEALAISEMFGPGKRVVATKAYTGHLLGAAGATEAVLAALSIDEGWVPGSLGCAPVEPGLGIEVLDAYEEIESDYVLSNSFAFGGSNVSVLLGAREP